LVGDHQDGSQVAITKNIGSFDKFAKAKIDPGHLRDHGFSSIYSLLFHILHFRPFPTPATVLDNP